MHVSMGAFRGMGRQLRPKSAPTNMRSTNRAPYVNTYARNTLKHMSDDEEEHFSGALPSQSDASATTQKPGILDRFDISYLAESERSGMQLGMPSGSSVSHAEMEVVLSQLQSATPETQMQGIQRMQAFEYSPDNAELLIQLGHLDALCALTAVFLRQRQQLSTETLGETLETHPGFCAMHIVFRIGAVTKGFRSVGAAIVALALAMPTRRDACVPGADGASDVQVPVEDDCGGFPPLSHIVANKSDPLKLGVIDDQQHFTWNPHSLNLQGLPHGNRKAVEAVAVGSHLWVYTLARGRTQKKAFQTFVQLLPAGNLFIGGKEQQVSAVSVVQGSSPELDAAFNLSSAQAACVFRVQAMPQDCALAATEPISLAFGARSIQERDSWIHGVSVIILRNSTASKSCALGAKLASTSTPIEEGSKSSFQGSCDEDGIPCGHGIALSLDGSKHMGNWVHGMLSGQGALLLPSGNKYMGEWKEGLAHGYGVHFSLKGTRYEGEWLNDAQHGYGVEYDATGMVYCGAFDDGQRHGAGILTENSVGLFCFLSVDPDPCLHDAFLCSVLLFRKSGYVG